MLSRCVLDFLVVEEAFVIGLSQISFFSHHAHTTKFRVCGCMISLVITYI